MGLEFDSNIQFNNLGLGNSSKLPKFYKAPDISAEFDLLEASKKLSKKSNTPKKLKNSSKTYGKNSIIELQSEKTDKTTNANETKKAGKKKVSGKNKPAYTINDLPEAKQVKKLRKKIDNLKASNGLTYKQACEIYDRIYAKYVPKAKPTGIANGVFDQEFENAHNPHLKRGIVSNGVLDYISYELNPETLAPDDKLEFTRARAAIDEIRKNNSALFAEEKAIDPFGIFKWADERAAKNA
ncbi:hypothetical protein J6G99_01400 [bacterium]|nr:hypothetical protein [bacterium]